MKVVRPGYLIFDRKRLIIIGWMFDAEKKSVAIEEMLNAIFEYLKTDVIVGMDSNKFCNRKKE